MADFEKQVDFAQGKVLGTSFDLRPDAVVSLVSPSPGPIAVGNISQGVMFKGWYARPDNDNLRVMLAESEGSSWAEETELFTFIGSSIDKLSLAFDATGRPIVAMERADGNLWIRYWDGAAYQLTDLGIGEAPAIIHRAPDNPFSDLLLFYQRGAEVYYRFASEDYATEWDPETTLVANQKIWRAILGIRNRVHLILSTRDPIEGTYTLQRLSTPTYDVACLQAEGYSERIDDGAETLLVFRGNGSISTIDCTVEIAAFLIGEGGKSGAIALGQGDPSILWCTTGGIGLDPDTDTPPAVHKADGGGHGINIDLDGSTGASGGGGGGQSPSNNAMWTSGGGGFPPQGHGGGGGQSTWGLLIPKRAASGGGGGYGGPGKSGTTLGGAPLAPGQPGAGAIIPGWNWAGPRGGRGDKRKTDADTGPVPGGGGSGGVRAIEGLVIPVGETIPVHVGQGVLTAAAGQGGEFGSTGITGIVVILARRLNLDSFDPAILTGGIETIFRGYKYHKFTSDGTIVVTTSGRMEALLVAGGGGGGSGAGGGGGGADVRTIADLISNDTTVTIGGGGAGGASGATGSDGDDTTFGNRGVAEGGGGGAGAPNAVAGSRASGGGGHGDGGAGGPGKAMRAYPGGKGEGFALSAGGDSDSAGGGGGAGGQGDRGATLETQGDELDDNWEVPLTGAIQISQQHYRQVESGGTDHTIIGSDVAIEKMMVQCRTWSGHSRLDVGPMARARHPTGDPDEVATGYYAQLNFNKQKFRNIVFQHALQSQHHIQIYAEDDLQEYTILGPRGSPPVTSLQRDSGTDAGENGNTRSFGWRARGNPISGTNKQGFCDDLMCFKDKNLEIGTVPAGGSAEVENEEGVVIASGSESGGIVLIDLSMYGDGSSGTDEPVPLGGFPKCVVRNSGGSIVAEANGAFYPGGEFDVSGSTLVVREDASGPEPIPIIGLLQYSTFSELTPGPEHGDGGPGRELTEWATATGEGDDSFFGGGGGGGAEIFVAGVGGEGGGGDGAFSMNAPTAGVANVGGGGGGSGDTTVAGAAGGSGLLVVRTEIPMPLGAEIPTSGLIVHHDAKLITGFEDGDVLTAWDDETAEGNDLANIGSPLYRDGLTSEGLNGWPAVRMDVGDYLQYASAFMSAETEGEIIVVFQNDQDGAAQNGFAHFSASDWSAHHPWTDGVIFETWGRAVRITAGNPADALDVPHLYNVKSISGEYTIWVNSTQLFTTGSNTPAFLSSGNPSVGKSKDAYYHRGLWGHILVYNRPLLTLERTNLRNYLNWYWDII